MPTEYRAAFNTTRWSRVMLAGAAQELAEDAAAQEALRTLCQDSWYPLYAFARRHGLEMHDAQDATQGFFLHLIESGLLKRARAERGRFRSFLLGAMQNYLLNLYRREQTQKRGGGETIVSLDEVMAEERFALEPAELRSPEKQFERSWAFALLERVMTLLRDDYARAGRADLHEKLQPYLAGKAQLAGYGDLGRELGMSEGAVAVAIHRMRKRYGELLRAEIAHTVGSPEEVETEIAHLLAAVAEV